LSPIQLTIEKPSMAGLLISSASTQPPREISAVAVGVCDSTSSVNKHLQIRFEVLRFPLPWGVANTVGLPRGDRTVMAQDAKATRYHDKDSLFGELRSHVPIVRARFGLIVGCSRGSTFTDY